MYASAKQKKRLMTTTTESASEDDIDPEIEIQKHFKSVLELNDYCWSLFS
jgi:hypothetical protein